MYCTGGPFYSISPSYISIRHMSSMPSPTLHLDSNYRLMEIWITVAPSHSDQLQSESPVHGRSLKGPGHYAGKGITVATFIHNSVIRKLYISWVSLERMKAIVSLDKPHACRGGNFSTCRLSTDSLSWCSTLLPWVGDSGWVFLNERFHWRQIPMRWTWRNTRGQNQHHNDSIWSDMRWNRIHSGSGREPQMIQYFWLTLHPSINSISGGK
jgi:hypothetical protein